MRAKASSIEGGGRNEHGIEAANQVNGCIP
jgi:hypothetical protein